LNKRAEEYRRLARECLALATTRMTPEARSALVEMARVWTRLADEQEVSLPPIPQPERPQSVMQQQQQSQPKKKGPGTV
jgi:hypothetical protein